MKPTPIQSLFLAAVKAALTDKQVEWKTLEIEDWKEIFRLASIHNVVPMVYESVYNCPAAETPEAKAFLEMYRPIVTQSVFEQTMRTMDFIPLYQRLRGAGARPIVVKGIVCRELYPKPDHRASNDEDVYIETKDFEVCNDLIRGYGMQLTEPDRDINEEGEVTYVRPYSKLRIELHKELFPKQNEAYGDLNRFFEGVFERAVEVESQGTKLLTMGFTDHMLYLILHAFKHFLHSGFGIRQVCDIVMFANAYGEKIDWDQVLDKCKEIRAERFTAALFNIGEKHLILDEEKSGIGSESGWSSGWIEIMEEVDEDDLLQDLLAAGVYGKADMSRTHSSTITLNSVAAQKQGKSGKSSVLKTLFPPVDYMKKRYSYLEAHPWMLPRAWVSRILTYRKETAAASADGAGKQNDAAESMRIGKQRVELMKEYGVLK